MSWLAPLATSPKIGRFQAFFSRISRANIVTGGTRNISDPKLGWYQKTSIAFPAPLSWLATLATFPKLGPFQIIVSLAPIPWLATLATSPKVGRVQKISIAFLAPTLWLAAVATSPKVGQLQKVSIAFISRANIVASGPRINGCSNVFNRISAFLIAPAIIGSAEGLPILCVRYFWWERERERERD